MNIILDFVKHNLGFHITFKTADLQDIIRTTTGDANNKTLHNLYLYDPLFTPSAETQAMFNESIKYIFNLSYNSWYTDRKVFNDGLEFQVDIGPAENIKSPKFLIAAHQFLARRGVPNKARKIAIFDNLDVRKSFIEIEGQRYPKDTGITHYDENDYLDEYRDPKVFYK